MGGDQAPEMIVQGVDIALERSPDLKIILVGDEALILSLLKTTKRLKKHFPEIIHTKKVIADEEKPSVALRQGQGSSMSLAIDLVGNGKADCVVSAGNTGALMAISKKVLRLMPGIDRPAIAGFFPTKHGESVMLDLGANISCDAKNLVQFSIMGQIFVRTVLGLRRPVVGILNVGIEGQKGNNCVREAAATLQRMTNMPFEFYGFVEGDDIPAGTVDVIVTDGFSGNIALKTAEGTSQLISQFLRDAFHNSLLSKIGYLLVRSAVKQLRQRIDPRRYNGAMVLGLNGIAVKSHGSTDALGFANAIGVAADMKRYRFLEKVCEELINNDFDLPEEQSKLATTA
ncbi:fatty acid/phospholipid synthesis protein PlsX [Candidatus Endolissoclinum faulkneri L5]|uniref:Phosphate acyltransferase n=2 Tax=Candidatus Endolissoclinum faulkneri TaxID=1263979 RepID=V9TT12_9PROT|nr:fatty acid/phospholipid synthesis protein PlsX [Candidatus Endolissoclinum faulkneri L5]